MGLDMYLEGKHFFGRYQKKVQRKGKVVTEITVDLGYWRKHPNLHGFIVQEFANGKDDCHPIQLNEEGIQKILAAINSNALPETTGFFFGKSDGSEAPEDIAIFEKALEWLKETDDDEAARWVEYRASW